MSVPTRSIAVPETTRDILAAAGAELWPELRLARADWVAYLTEKMAVPPGPASRTLHVGDVYLTCACLHRDGRALTELERQYLGPLRPFLERKGVPSFIADEAVQILRKKLLVSEPPQPPKLMEYGGKGPLATWLRIAALRVATDLLRAARPSVELEEQAAFLSDNPEVRYLKRAYGPAIRQIVQEAFDSLSVREQNVLRFYWQDGLTMERIAALHRVSHVSVSRWIARARQTLLRRIRGGLGRELAITPSEGQSLLRLMQSQLELRFPSLLSTASRPAKAPNERI